MDPRAPPGLRNSAVQGRAQDGGESAGVGEEAVVAAGMVTGVVPSRSATATAARPAIIWPYWSPTPRTMRAGAARSAPKSGR
jgi:hypothetical protein